MFTYSGSYEVINDGSNNWRVKFYGSGTYTSLVNANIDIFLVGGGGGYAWHTMTCGAGGSGIVIIRNKR